MIGFSPSGASRIARSTAPTTLLSHTLTLSMRASDADTDATWLIGVGVPYATTTIVSSRWIEARPVRRPLNSVLSDAIAPSMRFSTALRSKVSGIVSLSYFFLPLITVDTPCPVSTFLRPPRSRMRKTTIGILFSLSRLMAVASITFSSFESTSM